MNRPPDQPAVHIAANAARPALALVAIGSGTDPYDTTPEQAGGLAGQLTAAVSARAAALADR